MEKTLSQIKILKFLVSDHLLWNMMNSGMVRETLIQDTSPFNRNALSLIKCVIILFVIGHES